MKRLFILLFFFVVCNQIIAQDKAVFLNSEGVWVDSLLSVMTQEAKIAQLIRFFNKQGFSNTLLGDQVIKLKEKGFKNLSGKTSLTQAMEHIDNADLVFRSISLSL